MKFGAAPREVSTLLCGHGSFCSTDEGIQSKLVVRDVLRGESWAVKLSDPPQQPRAWLIEADSVVKCGACDA
jgi:hypothetical protein